MVGAGHRRVVLDPIAVVSLTTPGVRLGHEPEVEISIVRLIPACLNRLVDSHHALLVTHHVSPRRLARSFILL